MREFTDLPFNPKNPSILHLDINSCFATIEQQFDPRLRGKPVVVAAYTTDNGCILAPSIEAKTLGIKTGMRVKDARLICPGIVVLPSDPEKYRDVHIKLRELLKDYTLNVTPKSIDEFVLNLENYPAFKKGMKETSIEIKKRIREEIGEWITVSIGIAPNRFLAKTAAGLQKPDGLSEINQDNYLEIYSRLSLMDLCGIKQRNAARLGSREIYTVKGFLNADVKTLKYAFESINGYYWYLRLRGWEIDDLIPNRRSFGNSYALPKPFSKLEDLAPVLYKLVEKTGRRLRRAGYKATGVHVGISYRDGSYWHKGRSSGKILFDSRDIYKEAFKILSGSPYKKPVAILSESCFGLVSSKVSQTDLFIDIEKDGRLVNALDIITEKWGDFVIIPAKMLNTSEYVPDRISFGGVRELVQ